MLLMFAVSLKRLDGVAPSIGTIWKLFGSIYPKAKLTLDLQISTEHRSLALKNRTVLEHQAEDRPGIPCDRPIDRSMTDQY
jgi:hypothetical protein